jgi:hypothetical protein
VARGYLGVRDQALLEAVVTRDRLDIAQDFLARRADARPVAALGERKRIQVRRHVAGALGVAVVEPRAAERRRLFEDPYFVEAVLAQLDCGGYPAEPRTDDYNAQPPRAGHRKRF